MSDLADVLRAFRSVAGCDASLWMAEDGGPPRVEASTGTSPPPPTFPEPTEGARRLTGRDGDMLVTGIPGPRRAWLVLGPSADAGSLARYESFLLPILAQYLQSAVEVEHAANELAERYEEINLLYTISEILGRTVSLEETARTILTEVCETVGARRGSILVYDRESNALQPVAVLGASAAVLPIAADDDCSVSARVFRTQHPILAEPDQLACDAEAPYRRGAMLSVPIMWTAPPPRGAEPLGVVNLSDRRSGQPFSAGDQKLIAAIATQVGTAIQNARLVRASVDQQRLAHEMLLAHDLQMKLLPDSSVVAPDATVAARVVPAESVGGDFYNLFRLGGGKTGVMIGDVSGHGYQAALIMALSMSAAAIHSQSTADPGETLHALFRTLREELATTEMFISAFYAVVDPRAGEIRYANTGHPHAFVVSPREGVLRLPAADPPLGMDERAPVTGRRDWRPDQDMLVLFTDGMTDARNRVGERLGEERILSLIRGERPREPAQLVDDMLGLLTNHTQGAPLRDDLTIVVLKT